MEIESRMQRDEDDGEEEGDEEKFSQKHIQAILASLTKRIIDAEMEDFELVRELMTHIFIPCLHLFITLHTKVILIIIYYRNTIFTLY